jgi:hypothetical protein
MVMDIPIAHRNANNPLRAFPFKVRQNSSFPTAVSMNGKSKFPCTLQGRKLIFMEYNKIISVTGLPGLYELISSKNDGALVKSLDDQATRFVSSRLHNFSHLESIEVYTEDDNVNLADVFKAMAGSEEKMPDEKDAAAVRKYFEKVFPSMDMARVYNSDMKKMVRWFGILQKNKVEIKLSQPEPEAEEVSVPEPVESEEKPAKKTAKPKAAKEEPAAVAEEKTAKPKKAAPKKKKD